MPSSAYTAFDVLIDNNNGTTTPVANQTIKVRDVTNSANLPDLLSDVNGHVPSGTFNVAAGTQVRFRVENYQGMSGFAEQLTT